MTDNARAKSLGEDQEYFLDILANRFNERRYTVPEALVCLSELVAETMLNAASKSDIPMHVLFNAHLKALAMQLIDRGVNMSISFGTEEEHEHEHEHEHDEDCPNRLKAVKFEYEGEDK